MYLYTCILHISTSKRNYTIVSERSISNKKTLIIKVFHVAMNLDVAIFHGLDAHDCRKLQTDTQTGQLL